MSPPRHFLDLADLTPGELRQILDRAARFKAGDGGSSVMAGKTLAMIFEKPSTRTRVSFEVAAFQLGGHAIVLDGEQTQIKRGETIADTARVLSRYVDGILIRTDDPAKLEELARHASVPVINGLTDRSHPCQIVADLLTFEERFGPVTGQPIAWLGDGNNVAVSWMQAAALLGSELRLAIPESRRPAADLVRASEALARQHNGRLIFTTDPLAAVQDARAVITDTWVSMGDAAEQDGAPDPALTPFRVTEDIMAVAAEDAIFMHCLPALRDEEVAASVLDGPRSAVWDEAENRLHAQKAILAWCYA